MRTVGIVSFNLLLLCVFIYAITSTQSEVSRTTGAQPFSYHIKALDFIWNHLGYEHVWPEMEFGWRIVVGTLIGILGAAFGSVGGVGGGAAISAVFFCLKQKHPSLDEPVIDYDVMLLIQPMLMLGISIGVILSVIFADWMLTVLLIILCLVTSIRAFFKGAETWKKETKMKEETIKFSESTATCSGEEEYNYLPGCPDEGPENETRKPEIPISIGFYLYQARSLYQGRSAGGQHTHWPLHHLFLASIFSLLAGIVGGLLGTGSGFVMGPLFLEVGIVPQVASATATFGMMYSSSLSVVEYYLLNRFPVPYALFLTLVAAIAALLGQHIIDKLVELAFQT
ncbi:Sulfite exporter TauE/SafE family protein 3, partial [Mucuna pruriens]